MKHSNDFVAAILFSVGVTFAGTELFCRVTQKYSNNKTINYVLIAVAILLPLALVGVGFYYQFAPKPVHTTFIPQPTPPAQDNLWKKMNKTRWADSNGNQLFMEEGWTLVSTKNPIASGTIDKMNFSGTEPDGTDFNGTFSSDFSRFVVATNSPSSATAASATFSTSTTPVVTLTAADSDKKWNQFNWTSNADQEIYAFERSWLLSDTSGYVANGQLLNNKFAGAGVDGVSSITGNFSDDLKKFSLSATSGLIVYTFQGYQM